jgi:hypothetical protein
MMQLKRKLFCPWMMMLTCGMMKSCLVSGIRRRLPSQTLGQFRDERWLYSIISNLKQL